MSKPRIYIAISTFLPVVGGAEKQALLQAHSLCARGYEATVITLRHESAWPAHEVIEGVPVDRVGGSVLSGRAKLPGPLRKIAYLTGMLIIAWSLWRNRRRYDVLHVYQLNLLALSAALVCCLASKPMVVGVRVAPWEEAGQANKAPSLVVGPLDPATPWLKIDAPVQVGGDLNQLERLGKPVVRFTRFLLQRAGAVVVVLSSRMERYLAAHDFILPDIRLIPNGVDVARFSPGPSSARGVQAVVCVAQLRYEKGVDVLLQAWLLVHVRSPEARLLIVGNGPLRAQLERLAQALGVAESLHFVGEQSDVPAQLRCAKVAVLPSRTEGMPNALLEAMSCGLPCVATRVSGSEDIIQSGVNGLLVAPGDYCGIAQAILNLLCNHEVAAQYGCAARATVEHEYALDHIFDRYLEIYRELAERHSK
jgi:glycosyltransferase involved in cell wall biosynthesis